MIWLDAHLSPRVARWIQESLVHEARALRDLGLRDAEDVEVYERGKQEGAIILTKDKDFVDLVSRLGSPQPLFGCAAATHPRRCSSAFSRTISMTHWHSLPPVMLW